MFRVSPGPIKAVGGAAGIAIVDAGTKAGGGSASAVVTETILNGNCPGSPADAWRAARWISEPVGPLTGNVEQPASHTEL